MGVFPAWQNETGRLIRAGRFVAPDGQALINSRIEALRAEPHRRVEPAVSVIPRMLGPVAAGARNRVTIELAGDVGRGRIIGRRRRAAAVGDRAADDRAGGEAADHTGRDGAAAAASAVDGIAMVARAKRRPRRRQSGLCIDVPLCGGAIGPLPNADSQRHPSSCYWNRRARNPGNLSEICYRRVPVAFRTGKGAWWSPNAALHKSRTPGGCPPGAPANRLTGSDPYWQIRCQRQPYGVAIRSRQQFP